MKNVLIINGHQYYPVVAEGKLTQNIINSLEDFCKEKGFEVKSTQIDKQYIIKDELEKFAWANVIILQYPVYWMGVPWITKKYIDEIFSYGKDKVTYVDDGRSRKDPSKKYGSGGLMQGKHYMLSLTYNCPLSEFDNKEGFFEGLSIDQANISVHKTFQFCGAQQLETYSIHDVFKGDLDLKRELQRLEEILEKNFS